MGSAGFDFTAVGKPLAPLDFTYTWKDAALYALGIGATERELDFLYEGRGPRVYPTFGVVPILPLLFTGMDAIRGDPSRVVHGAQKLRMHAREIPSAGTVRTVAQVDAIYDLKRLAQAIVSTRTTDAASGELLWETEASLLFVGMGGFGGESRIEPRPRTPDRTPDFVTEARTAGTQALLYRLSGDLNPLHADPEFPLVREQFQGRPILHGLATYGYLARAVVLGPLGGDPARLRSVEARFARPVFPGDTLRTEAWVEAGRVIARVSVPERNEQVLTHCVCEID